MRHLLIRLAVGLTTFFVGVCLPTLFVGTPHLVTVTAPLPVLEAPKAETPTSQAVTEICFRRLWNNKEISNEEKAVIAAQAFVTLEDYTNGILGSCNMALPCVEGRGAGEVEGRFRARYDTLECRAYGVSHFGRGGSKGWTVAFRYTERMGGSGMKTGRAVTMDEDFRNLRVEHCDFFLNKVEKKL
jgi:hypothetical protein